MPAGLATWTAVGTNWVGRAGAAFAVAAAGAGRAWAAPIGAGAFMPGGTAGAGRAGAARAVAAAGAGRGWAAPIGAGALTPGPVGQSSGFGNRPERQRRRMEAPSARMARKCACVELLPPAHGISPPLRGAAAHTCI